jgi:hypothetical protein
VTNLNILYNLTHGLLTLYRLFSLLCCQCSLLFCDTVLLCITVFLLCVELVIVLVLYCVGFDVRAATLTEVFPCSFLDCKANSSAFQIRL